MTGPGGTSRGAPAGSTVRVRWDAPRAQTVVARVAGTVDASTADAFVEQVASPFGAVLHVVVDLAEVPTLTGSGLRALLELDRAATRRGTQLHITGAALPRTSHHVAGHLLRLGTDHLLQVADPEPTAAASRAGRSPLPASRVGITGHSDLLPPSLPVVRDALHAQLRGRDGAAWVGVSCLARGTDQLFADLVLELGGRLEVILPAADYRARKVESADAAEFDRLLAAAAAVTVLEFDVSCRAAYMAASNALLDTVDELIAVWDGRPARRHGSTGDVVAAARLRELPITVLWPPAATRTAPPAGLVPARARQ